MGEILKKFNNITGFLGAAIFLQNGKLLEASPIFYKKKSEIPIDTINNILYCSREITDDIGMGRAEFIQIELESSLILARSYKYENNLINILLCLNKDSDIDKFKTEFKTITIKTIKLY